MDEDIQKMSRRHPIRLAVWYASAVIACEESGGGRSDSAASITPGSASSSASVAARCYRSPQSVLLGPITPKSRNNGKGPGWIRMEGFPAAGSGGGNLIDESRAGLGASWRRGFGDSVSITAFDDFLRVELRLIVSDTAAIGSALARSDADLEPDSTGKLQDFRREWDFRAVIAPCDSMPLHWTRKS